MSREFQRQGARLPRLGRGTLVALLLIPASIFFLVPRLWAQNPAPKKASATASTAFDHAEHAKRIKKDDCSFCHRETHTAKPSPTTRSHTPCLASGCHIDDFLSTGPRALKDSPKAYASASLFCATCHKSADGKPPNRFSRAAADALFEDKVGASFHVEMNHHEHSNRTACSSCHKVDAKSFKLVAAGPGHTECKSCHEDSEQPMTACKSCHTSPGPAAYFTKTRKDSDVRSCSTESTADQPCFKHEREEHRLLGDKSPLECSSCHYMFKKKANNGKAYTSLADVKSAPIIDNRRDQAHKSCGTSGCHRREVDDSMGTGKCAYCHSKQFMASSIFN